MLGDLKNRRWIIAKGLMFFAMGLLASAILLLETQSWSVAILLGAAVWAFCRFYYFAFYVIEHYVDAQYRFTGLVDFVRYLLRGRKN